jgi:hypothetical protein
MKTVGLGKGQGFADEAGQALAQGIEPALDMTGFAAVFADRLMAVSGKHKLVSLPEIAERAAMFVSQRDASPELATTGFTAVTNEVGDNLAGPTTQRGPDPAFVRFLEHKGPQFVQFQHIIPPGISQRRCQRWQVFGPVFNPVSNRPPRDAQYPLDAAQADPFAHRPFHLRTAALVIAALGLQGAIAVTAFAVVFLGTFVIMAVLDHVFTPAFRTRVRYNRLYHEKVLQVNLCVCPGLPFHASSVKFSPLPGYKLVTLSTLDGLPVVYELVPANTEERQAAETVLPYVHNVDIFGDKGFIGAEWQEQMRQQTGNRIWTAKRANQKEQNPPEFDRILNRVRERIEGVFHEIQNTGRNLERLLTKKVVGFCTRVIAKLTSHALKLLLRRDFGIDVQSFTVNA